MIYLIYLSNMMIFIAMYSEWSINLISPELEQDGWNLV
jgi:hypothetical protein